MKINKKLLMFGTAITSIVAPIATVISCGENNNANANGGSQADIPVTPGKSHSVDPTYIPVVLDLSTYVQYTSYDPATGTLTVKPGVVEITNIFKDGYIPTIMPMGQDVRQPINALKLPSTLKKIDDNAFESAKLKKLTIPNSVTSIGKYAFYNSQLTSLTLGTSLQTIG